MRTISGLLGLVIAAVIVYFIYTSRFGGKQGDSPPKQQIDITGVRMDLFSLAQAEKRYAAIHGSYAALDQLQKEESGLFKGNDHRGYTFEVDVEDAQRFRITAKPADPDRMDWPTLSVDETGQISTQNSQ
jgi:hypothetical protein